MGGWTRDQRDEESGDVFVDVKNADHALFYRGSFR